VYNKKKDDSSEGVEREEEKLIDRDNSPIQLISQIKGYFYVNSFIAISLAITLFSFVGVPPIMGFFAKQMILSAALDSGYVFMTFIAILTSVIGAGYYLNLVKQIFFFKDNYKKNLSIANLNLTGYILPASLYNSKTIRSNLTQEKLTEFKPTNITIASSFSISISIITLLLILFIYIPGE
jgi:NADH-ubiquinone oxidoreductase chain 2